MDTIFQFLDDVRVTGLDGLISENNQSLLVEVVFWTVAFTVFAQVGSRIIRSVLRKTRIWTRAHKQGGIFIGNGRDDSVLLLVFGLHHGYAAWQMYLGIIQGSPSLWKHGYLIETGFEVADLCAMILKSYPYTAIDGMKPELKAALFLHHFPGIVLSAFVMETGLYENVHMQQIALILLGGAFVSCWSALFVYQLDLKTQMTQAALAFNASILFFIWCRCYVFPIESFGLLRDVRSDPELSDSIVLYLLYIGGVLMTLFNLGVLADAIPKMFRYTKRAFDGVTPIETEPVPSSRDSILNSRKRRSSVMVVVSGAVSPATRSSFASVMGLNTIEDVIQAEKRPSHFDAITEEEAEDAGLSEQELKELNKTLGKVAKKTK